MIPLNHANENKRQCEQMAQDLKSFCIRTSAERTTWEIGEKKKRLKYFLDYFSPSYRWCRACFYSDERDLPIPSLVKLDDRATYVVDGIEPKHPSPP